MTNERLNYYGQTFYDLSPYYSVGPTYYTTTDNTTYYWTGAGNPPDTSGIEEGSVIWLDPNDKLDFISWPDIPHARLPGLSRLYHEKLHGLRCDYCGTPVREEGRVNCKQCGAPLRSEG